ncbi:DUF4405 domain-containing protein [Desulfobacter vibrioformis]|uniref:DUF4405 domain-containing protein n=1 Tax=Desulfobacter vibrioformis TaxID=34031 RepID=UPI0005550704|nr:DUF4405 domain-containing protein [Desulfobacter vibrioformis]
MKIRRVVSLTSALSFVVTVVTSVVLYIVPQGRIAYWANWRLWGLTKEQWGGIHINVGILFIIGLGFHIYYNWKPMMTYLKNNARNLKIFTKEFNLALVITLVFIVGTYIQIPPFSSILEISGGIKDDYAQKHGEPPYGHAELSSLKTFSQKIGIDMAFALSRIKEKGYQVQGADQTLLEISKQNKISPQQIYLAIQSKDSPPAVQAGKAITLPGTPPAGTGNMTLADLCSQYNLNIKTIRLALAASGIKVKEDLTLKRIAEQNGVSPKDIYEKIKAVSADQ